MKALRLRPALVAASAIATAFVVGTGSPATAVPATCGLAAHRGDHSGSATENSLNAMSDAISDGADYLELDVRVSKDGHLFLMHDKTVDRTTNGTGAISSMTKKQVRALRLTDGEHVPYLSVVLAMAKSSSVDVLLEIKAMGGKSTYRDLASQVRGYGVNRIRVTSFSRKRLDKLHAIAPDIHELLNTSQRVSRGEVSTYGAVAINVHAVTDQWIQKMSAYPTFVYVSDTLAEWDHYAPKVAGVITNEPVQFEQNRPVACPSTG